MNQRTARKRPIRPFSREARFAEYTTQFRRRRLTAAELFAGSFLALIVAGTLGLKLLPGLYTGEPLNWTDAVFTATSAVCVTGLIVVDTATYFTFAGQLYLLALIQFGGLGMLTLTSLVITALGGRPSLRSESIVAGNRPGLSHVSPRALIRDVVLFTVAFEALGALALYSLWAPRLGWQQAIWPSVFHSISAFCNAGFSTNTDSLMSLQQSPASLLVVSLLIIAGGLGFVAIEDLAQRLRRAKARRRLSVHTKLALTTSAALLLGAWPLFAVFEWNESLRHLSLTDKLINAWFMSVTPRTAGFNTIDYGQATDSTNFLTMLLMMIGGSPGSTAGGIKTTTFILLGLLAWSRLRSFSSVTFGGRSIPPETIERATGLFVIASGIVVAGIFALTTISDFSGSRGELTTRMFEVVSAFNTVGLSMGLTPDLSPTSRWLTIGLMFVGRIGPLSLAAVLRVQFTGRGRFRLAHEDVVVG